MQASTRSQSCEGWNTLTVDHCLQVFSTIHWRTKAKLFLSALLQGYTTVLITPMRQASTCCWVQALGETPSAPKPWRSDVHVKSKNPVTVRLPLTKSKKKKNYREHSNLKSVCHYADGLSATQNGLNRAFSTSCDLSRKVYMTFAYSNLEPILCVQDCHSQIAQIEYLGQIQYTRILHRKPFINTWYFVDIALDIDWSLNIFNVQNCCSMLIKKLINLKKVRTENFEIEFWMVGQ